MEIGCGTGHLLSHVITASPHLETSGSDVLEAGLKYAAARVPRVTFYQIDARQMPFEEEFDVVGAYDVLEHIEEERQVLAEIFRALKPGGGAILTVPQHSFLWGPADEYSRHKRRYTRSGLVETVKATGFDVIRATSWVSLLLPALLLSRMRERRGSTAFDPIAEFQSSARLNKVLAWISSVERTLITRGLSFAAGGSLLVVVRKPSVASAAQSVSST
jgi:SAM-dependent methyltransferase